ncbi:hypothetical protein C0995_015361, partial [Termitomyces sp. Mi166
VLRALTHYTELYGSRNAGQEDLKTTELPGAELIDGTLFVRTAVLLNERLKLEKDVYLAEYWDRVLMDEKLAKDINIADLAKYWDRKGFYKASSEPEGITQ